MSINLDQDAVDRATVAMCEAAGVPCDAAGEFSKDMREQVIAFVLALNKNYEREQQYEGLWKSDTIAELGQHVTHKGKRMESTLTPGSVSAAEAVTDDAIDAINYAAFVARQAHYAVRDNV